MAQNDLTTFICLFHSASRAESALSALENAGFNRNAITSTWKSADESDYSAELTRLGVPQRDLGHLESGLRKGGVVLSLEAGEGRSDEIERIFHHYSADKIDEADNGRGTAAGQPVAAAVPAGGKAVKYADSVVIPVAEEQLTVGKRAVDEGGVRVFRRTVEEPVSETVNLREEHVVIDRQSVNRPVTDADLQAGGQSIELTETDEVPVVTKVARVVEEVRVGVVGSEHTEVIQDTVRHTEVELESIPATDESLRTRGDVRRS